MMKRKLGFAAGIGAAALMAASSANAFTINFTDTNAAPTAIYFSGPSNGVTLTARITFDLTAIAANSATFSVTVENLTAVATDGDNRLVSFGITQVDPEIDSASASLPWYALFDKNFAGGYGFVDLCAVQGSGNNCNGGANDGVGEASSSTFTLTIGTAGNFLTSGITFTSPIVARYQAIGLNSQSDELKGCVEGTPNCGPPPCVPGTPGCEQQVPEPGTLALLGLGLLGLGLGRRRVR